MYALKLELKLNNKERSRLAGCAGFSRFVFNFGLALLTQSWAWTDVKAGDSKRLGAIEKVFTNHVKTNPDYAWMQKYPSAIYSQAFRHLGDAIKRWRQGKGRFPKFKRKRDKDSFTVLKKSGVYPAKGQPMIQFTNRQVLYPGKGITIPGLGGFKVKRPIPYLCSSQTFTIARHADKWYVSFTIDAQKVPPTHHEVAVVGIDLGVKTFATLSDNSTIDAPNSIKIAKTKLGKEQWRNRKRQHGRSKRGIPTSRNAKKFYDKVAQRHARIANIRQDFLQKVTTAISRKYYRIRIEDLNVSGMMRHSKLSDAIGNLGFYEFRRQLTYKQDFYGTVVELVDRWYPSSKTCSDCGHVQQMTLRDRTFTCKGCGVVKCRDFNASVNLENAPNAQVRRATAELNACGEEGADSPRGSRKQTSKRKS